MSTGDGHGGGVDGAVCGSGQRYEAGPSKRARGVVLVLVGVVMGAGGGEWGGIYHDGR